jgi:hypothetical protein
MKLAIAPISLAASLALIAAAGAQAAQPAGGTTPSTGSTAAAPPPTGSTGAAPPASTTGAPTSSTQVNPHHGSMKTSPTGAASATENAGPTSATAPADLSGLKTGLTVKDSTGATIGTVSKVQKTKAGKVRTVMVSSADGKRTMHLAPSTLSVSGDVVTTTSTSPSTPPSK